MLGCTLVNIAVGSDWFFQLCADNGSWSKSTRTSCEKCHFGSTLQERAFHQTRSYAECRTGDSDSSVAWLDGPLGDFQGLDGSCDLELGIGVAQRQQELADSSSGFELLDPVFRTVSKDSQLFLDFLGLVLFVSAKDVFFEAGIKVQFVNIYHGIESDQTNERSRWVQRQRGDQQILQCLQIFWLLTQVDNVDESWRRRGRGLCKHVFDGRSLRGQFNRQVLSRNVGIMHREWVAGHTTSTCPRFGSQVDLGENVQNCTASSA
ncbi:hypothetical protein OGAPHI_006604 [Ogataea philodendri]|uniref:Uncharacterized protein n=1 Tax=Ogataea philodendri TaxID=1378263 RepID=A0A9P8NXV2_9ASCO|nr:uncharacterized protein OGAPHI_006604 [Ogataea philodendri]KAH3661197.1 hypothetical protein OGAPHI_006604 [Ogataea philodendri]